RSEGFTSCTRLVGATKHGHSSLFFAVFATNQQRPLTKSSAETLAFRRRSERKNSEMPTVLPLFAVFSAVLATAKVRRAISVEDRSGATCDEIGMSTIISA